MFQLHFASHSFVFAVWCAFLPFSFIWFDICRMCVCVCVMIHSTHTSHMYAKEKEKKMNKYGYRYNVHYIVKLMFCIWYFNTPSVKRTKERTPKWESPGRISKILRATQASNIKNSLGWRNKPEPNKSAITTTAAATLAEKILSCAAHSCMHNDFKSILIHM